MIILKIVILAFFVFLINHDNTQGFVVNKSVLSAPLQAFRMCFRSSARRYGDFKKCVQIPNNSVCKAFFPSINNFRNFSIPQTAVFIQLQTQNLKKRFFSASFWNFHPNHIPLSITKRSEDVHQKSCFSCQFFSDLLFDICGHGNRV